MNASQVVMVYGADGGDFVKGKLIWSALNALAPAKTRPPAVVDLSEVKMARPYTLAAIAALGCLADRSAKLIVPAERSPRDWVVRAGLLDFFSDASESTALSPSSLTVPVRQLTSVMRMRCSRPRRKGSQGRVRGV